MTAIVQRETEFNREQIDLIKGTVAVGCTDLELALFLEVCKSTGLNPFLKQIYAIRRKTGRDEKMTIQTGIDGYRLIAARTGTHLGTTDPEFGPVGQDGYPEWARVVARRLVQGHVAEFPATARWSEYVQTKNEWRGGQATGNKVVSDMWARMPFTMLGKCAEALALRKSFPGELSGVYSDIEMQQADSGETAPAPAQVNPDSDPEKLAAWGDKLKKITLRLVELGLKGEALGELKLHDWQTSIRACSAAYEGLKAIGQAHAEAQKPQEAPAEVEAVELITDTQRKALMAQVKRVGIMDSSERRAQFWAFVLNDTIKPTATNELTSEDAQTIIDILKAMNATEAQAMGTEFAEKVPV